MAGTRSTNCGSALTTSFPSASSLDHPLELLLSILALPASLVINHSSTSTELVPNHKLAVHDRPVDREAARGYREQRQAEPR